MKKYKIFSIVITVVVLVALLAVGVYSASINSQTSSGTIGFITNNISATVECYVGSAEGNASKTVEYTTDPQDNAVTDSWSVSSLAFETDQVGVATESVDDIAPIVLTFVVTNTSSRTAYAYFTKSSAANATVCTSDTLDGTLTDDENNLVNEDVVDVVLTGVTEIASGQSETLTITFTLTEYEFSRNDTTEAFSYYLNINSFNPTN